MNNKLTSDCIAVDTNVFKNLLNPKYNKNNHIRKIFECFIKDKISLLVDSTNKITTEYSKSLSTYIKKATHDDNRIVLYNFYNSRKIKVPVDLSDDLMDCITQTVPKDKGTDRFFVYVAFKKGKILITNNTQDMILGKHKKDRTDEKRRMLLKCCQINKKYKGANILTSKEVSHKLQ